MDVAEREGFEPSIRCRIHAFQACSLSRSDTSPEFNPTSEIAGRVAACISLPMGWGKIMESSRGRKSSWVPC